MIQLASNERRISLYYDTSCQTIFNDRSLLTEGVKLDLIDIR